MTSPVLTLAAVLAQSEQRLAAAGIVEARGDAKRLIAFVLGIDALTFIASPDRAVNTAEEDRVAVAVARRAARVPVSRIIGEREFYGRPFKVTSATLDPRADSELIVEHAIAAVDAAIARGVTSPHVLDVGTGTGCLLLSILAERPTAIGTATDISSAALDVARENVAALRLSHRVRFFEADGLARALSAMGHIPLVDVIVSNPPYIERKVIGTLTPEVRNNDPRLALDGGVDGFDFYRTFAETLGQGCSQLSTMTAIVLEIGHNQADLARSTFADPSIGGVVIHKDIGGNDRCAILLRTAHRHCNKATTAK